MKGLEQFVCCGWYYKVYVLCSFLSDVIPVSNSYLDQSAWLKMAHHRPSPSTKPVPALFLGSCVFVLCETEAGTCSASQIKEPKDQATAENFHVPCPLGLWSCSFCHGHKSHAFASGQEFP